MDELTLAEPYLQKIRQEFPDLQWQTHRYIDEGWDHAVVILDDKLVFRFPLDDEYATLLLEEIEILAYLEPKISVSIPHYTHIVESAPFAGYPMVRGDQLTLERFRQLSPDAYRSFVKQLAAFLSVIHTIDTAIPELAKVSKSYLPDDQAHVREVAEAQLHDMLTAQEYAQVQTILEDVDQLLQTDLPNHFIHSDIYARHLLWDDEAHKLGIIDFSDMCFSDPAFDFAELYEYGVQFVHDVYEAYTGPKDATFLTRAWKYECWTAVYMMTDYFDYQKTTFAVARETFDMLPALTEELQARSND